MFGMNSIDLNNPQTKQQLLANMLMNYGSQGAGQNVNGYFVANNPLASIGPAMMQTYMQQRQNGLNPGMNNSNQSQQYTGIVPQL